MEIGKVPENVLKRSILKQIKTKRPEVLVGADVGEDCAIIGLEPDEVMVLSTDPITGTTKEMGRWAVMISANDIASSGAEVIGVLVCALLPPRIREIKIREMMQEIESCCQELNIQVVGGHTEITDAVTRPVLTITGIGKVKKDRMLPTRGAKPGQDIVMTKWAALEGSSILAKEREEELLQKFPKYLVEEVKGYSQYLSILKEAAIAGKSNVSAMHDVSGGGIFAALWELAESAGVGLAVDLKKIPIRQETVEVCEFFGISPYELLSGGCLLMTADSGEHLVQALEADGIPGTVIGTVTDNNDRIVINEEEKRFLERPGWDEINKI